MILDSGVKGRYLPKEFGVLELIVQALSLRKLLFDRNKDAIGALKKHGDQAQIIKVIHSLRYLLYEFCFARRF